MLVDRNPVVPWPIPLIKVQVLPYGTVFRIGEPLKPELIQKHFYVYGV
jgi:hypothetical protein